MSSNNSNNSSVYIEEYSPKSFVVRGDTQPIKDQLKSLGGKWSSGFTDKETGEKFGAWLFWTAKKEEVEQFLTNKKPVEKQQSKIYPTNNIEKQQVYPTNNSEKRMERMEMMILDVVGAIQQLDPKTSKKLMQMDWYKELKEPICDYQKDLKEPICAYQVDCDDYIEDVQEDTPRKRLLKKK